MPVPLAGAAIAGAIGVITGRLIKKQVDTHKKMENTKREMHTYKPIQRNTGGVTPSTKTVDKLYRPSK
jgi:hypothetical protein